MSPIGIEDSGWCVGSRLGVEDDGWRGGYPIGVGDDGPRSGSPIGSETTTVSTGVAQTRSWEFNGGFMPRGRRLVE